MRKTCFVLFFYLISVVCFSQSFPVSVTKSETLNDVFKHSVVVLADKDSGGNILFARYHDTGSMTSGDGLYIEKYSPNLKLIKEFEFKVSHLNYEKYNMIVGAFSSENTIHLIEIYYDLNDKAIICRSHTINADFETSQKELFRLTKEEVRELGSFSLQQIFYDRSKEMWTNSNSGDIKSETDLAMPINTFPTIDSGISMVVNESKTAFAIALDTKQKNTKRLKLYLFNSNLEKKIDSDFTRSAKDDEYIFKNVQVSEDGNAIYILGKSYAKALEKKEKGGKYFFELSKITSTSNRSVQIDPGDHFIGVLKPFFQKDAVYCLGFYSDFDDRNFIGTCFFKTTSDLLQIAISKFNPFTKSFMIDRDGEKKEYKALINLSIKNVSFTSSDDLIINAEEEEVSTISSGAGVVFDGTKTTSKYKYGDIVSTKLNNFGNVLWARNINKRQTYSDEDSFYISYTSMLKNDQVYFFINAGDNVTKLKDDRIEFGKVRKDQANLNLIRINSNGDFEYKEILNTAESSIPFMVSKGVPIDNSIYFFGRKGKEKQLLKVTLN